MTREAWFTDLDYQQFISDYGIEILIEKSSLEEWEVLEILHTSGYITLEDIFDKEYYPDETEDT